MKQAEVTQTTSDDGRHDMRRGFGALVLFFVIFGGWAAMAPLDAAVVAQGVVVVSGNRQTVQHREGGTITRLDVKEGEHVRRDQVLVELSSPELLAQQQSLFAQVIDLQLQRSSLIAETTQASAMERPTEWENFSPEDRATAERAYQRYVASRRNRRTWSEYDERIAGLRSELRGIDRQTVLVQDELDRMAPLIERGLVPLTRVRGLERTIAELEGRRGNLAAQIAGTRENRVEELRRVEARLSDILPRLIGVREQVERMRLRAPVDGVVVALSAHTIGGVVNPGERVMDIVPDRQPLLVQAQVLPQDADDLVVGFPAQVRITAFTGRRMPILSGTIEQVSADRFEDQRTGQAYFRAMIAVSPAELERLAEGSVLRAGLPAEIVAPTGQRTALQYLVEPLNQSLWRSFREP